MFLRREQRAHFVAGKRVPVDREVCCIETINTDAAGVIGRHAGKDHELVGAAHFRVLDGEPLDGRAVGHGDGGPHALAVHDGGDAAAETLAAIAGDQDGAAPQRGVRLQDDVFVVGAGGVVDVDVARAEDGVGALLDGGKGTFRGAVAGNGNVAIDELHVGQKQIGLVGRTMAGRRVFRFEVGILDQFGLFEADLGIAHDHLGEAVGGIAGLARQARLGGGERIAALRDLGQIERHAETRAGEPIAAGQVFVLVQAGIQEEGREHPQFAAGFPSFGVVAEVPVEVVVAAEHPGFEDVGLDGQAQADFPIIAAESLLVLLEGLGGGGGGDRARADVVLQHVVVFGIGISPVRRCPDVLPRRGFGIGGDHDFLVAGIVVVRARVDPFAQQFQAHSPLVVIGVAGIAVVVIGVCAEDQVQLGQQLAITDAEIAFLRVVVGYGRAGIDEQKPRVSGIPHGDEHVAETFRFGIARLETDRQLGRREGVGVGVGVDRDGRGRLLGLGFGLGFRRLGGHQRTERESDENHQERANPTSTHCSLPLQTTKRRSAGIPKPCA